MARILLQAWCIGFAAVAVVPAGAQGTAVTIETAGGHADELAMAQSVRRLIDAHELDDWMFTDRILIDRETRIPHSHPVLTLTTRYFGDDLEILTNIIHEQLHWFVLEHQDSLAAATAAMRERYPDAPDGPPEGARDQRSTYLHLVVCTLEYLALEGKIGREAAAARLRDKPYYTWVFATVVDDRESLRSMLENHGIVLP